MACLGVVRQVWRGLRSGQVPEMENTTALGASQAAISEPNQHSSLGSTAERSSDPTRSKQTSLCNICAHGLSLDDSRAGGALGEPRDDGTPNLCFPFIGERERTGWSCDSGDHFTWKGGAQYEQREITPPHLPELLDECKFCHKVKTALLNQLGRHEWWHTTTTKLRYLVQYEWLGSKKEGCQLLFKLSSLNVEAKHPELDRENRICWIDFPIATSSNSCREWLHITGRPVHTESSFSERNVFLIRKWLKQCNTNPRCRLSMKQEFLPTRLLDVGSPESDDPSITLVDTHSMAQLKHADHPPEYICLSYRWGDAEPPLTTKKGTIEGYKAGIPTNLIPKVFSDAIEVTRKLGIRYLWIDALCIIQDCPEDWENESAAMADIFSHSWMTVGAVTTSSCHETLFYPRQNLSIDIEFQSSIKQDITGTISILLLNEYFDSPLKETLKNSTWNTRGWVWQEQKLPQRLLMFGEKMLHLRCHERLLHEYSTNQHWTSHEDGKVSLRDLKLWTSVMEDYSRRELSKGSDRLAAISGYAKAVAQELEDAGKPGTYIAGIWLANDADLSSQLSWILANPSMSFGQLLRYHRDPQQYIAPSWSWAALNEPINRYSHDTDQVFNVVAHNIKPARSDAMVAIAPGSSITLSGELRNIPGRPSMGNKTSGQPLMNIETWWESRYYGYEYILLSRGREENFERKIRYFLDWIPSSEDSADGDLEAHLKLFLLSDLRKWDGISAMGLVLFPVAADSRVFFRVGCFDISGPYMSLGWEKTEVVVI